VKKIIDKIKLVTIGFLYCLGQFVLIILGPANVFWFAISSIFFALVYVLMRFWFVKAANIWNYYGNSSWNNVCNRIYSFAFSRINIGSCYHSSKHKIRTCLSREGLWGSDYSCLVEMVGIEPTSESSSAKTFSERSLRFLPPRGRPVRLIRASQALRGIGYPVGPLRYRELAQSFPACLAPVTGSAGEPGPTSLCGY